MSSEREERFGGKSHSEVADFLSHSGAGSYNAHFAESEFLLRQTELLDRATVAQEKASEATIETAKHTSRSATYMLISVVVLALSSVASFSLDWWKFEHPANSKIVLKNIIQDKPTSPLPQRAQ